MSSPDDLRAEWGIQFRRLAPVLRLLANGPVPAERLIAETGLSHRTVTDLLARAEHGLPPPPAPASISPDVASALARLRRAAPRARRELDHVAATAETVLHRATFLAERYWLEGAEVVCLGDHDLTSLALALAVPGVRVSVADIDDELLAFIDRSARDLGVEVRCRFADLRLGLPPSLRESADLVFADPPYTPEGVRLFAARGCQALRRDDRSRLLLCYGHSERQPALGIKVQSAIHGLRLLIEELLPGFNRYEGAPAIGGASALYVTRPVADTWHAAERADIAVHEIYTHGPMAVESGVRALPDAIRAAAPGLIPVADLWQLSERHAQARPHRRPGVPDTAAVDLRDVPALASRLLLVSRARRLRLVLPAAAARELLAPDGWPAQLLGAAYRLTEVAREGDVRVVEAERRADEVEGAELVARWLVEHPHATLGSAVREALIAVGRAPTKNEARAMVAENADIAAHVGARASELPEHVLRAVAIALPVLVAGEAVTPPGIISLQFGSR